MEFLINVSLTDISLIIAFTVFVLISLTSTERLGGFFIKFLSKFINKNTDKSHLQTS